MLIWSGSGADLGRIWIWGRSGTIWSRSGVDLGWIWSGSGAVHQNVQSSGQGFSSGAPAAGPSFPRLPRLLPFLVSRRTHKTSLKPKQIQS